MSPAERSVVGAWRE
jgi:hypothetical protein